MPKDPVRVAVHVAVYIVLFVLSTIVLGWALLDTGYLVGTIATTSLAALFANWLALRIFEGRSIIDVGLWWNRAASENLILGLAGGVACASMAIVPPLIFRVAHIVWTPFDQPSWDSKLFVAILLAAGVAGEELLFRGYGFQVLLPLCGRWGTVTGVGALFALMHWSNPNAGWLGLVNTAGFGMLFGYAYVRSRDLWLPIGLHMGWNFTLPLFGVNLSGLRMKVTGYEMSWTAGALWSGGEYGPEASVLTSAVVLLLFAYLWKAPIRRQVSPISDPPRESVPCEPSPSSPSFPS
jgi:membrane protease YdiL (CAAX protease family)